MVENDQMQALLESPTATIGYVYREGQREKYWFDGTPENIASFLMRFPDADQVTLTDRMDLLVLNTIGPFIDSCPDRSQLPQILAHLLPMQRGEVKPGELFCPSEQQVNEHLNQVSAYDMTFG